MKNKKKNNLVKYILFAVLGVIALVVVLPLLGGILTGLNPNRAKQMAEQKMAQNKVLYVPEGYQILKLAEKQDLDGLVIYVTELKSESNSIQIIQEPNNAIECKGDMINLSNFEVCHNVVTYKGSSHDYYIWSVGNLRYQIGTTTGLVSQEEIAKIISSL